MQLENNSWCLTPELIFTKTSEFRSRIRLDSQWEELEVFTEPVSKTDSLSLINIIVPFGLPLICKVLFPHPHVAQLVKLPSVKEFILYWETWNTHTQQEAIYIYCIVLYYIYYTESAKVLWEFKSGI